MHDDVMQLIEQIEKRVSKVTDSLKQDWDYDSRHGGYIVGVVDHECQIKIIEEIKQLVDDLHIEFTKVYEEYDRITYVPIIGK